jgi:cysteine desulfurase
LIYHLYREAIRTDTPVHVVLSAVEHPCLLRACEAYAGPWLSFDLVPVDEVGRVAVADVLALCTDQTRLVSVMLANNELGTIQPIADISKALQDRPIWIHTDATQAPGKLPFDVHALGVHFLTLSAHKVYAPKGTGLLYVRPGISLSPMIYGGGQEGRMRAGTENTLGIVAFGHALQMADVLGSEWVSDCLAVKDSLSEALDIPGCTMNSPLVDCLPNTLNLRFSGVTGAALAMRLDLAGVAISTGAACSTGAIEPSHVLLATGQSSSMAAEAIRLSWGWGTTTDQACVVVSKLRDAVAGIRSC